MHRQRTLVSWRHGRDTPSIKTIYVDYGPATTQPTRHRAAVRTMAVGTLDCGDYDRLAAALRGLNRTAALP